MFTIEETSYRSVVFVTKDERKNVDDQCEKRK